MKKYIDFFYFLTQNLVFGHYKPLYFTCCNLQECGFNANMMMPQNNSFLSTFCAASFSHLLRATVSICICRVWATTPAAQRTLWCDRLPLCCVRSIQTSTVSHVLQCHRHKDCAFLILQGQVSQSRSLQSFTTPAVLFSNLSSYYKTSKL